MFRAYYLGGPLDGKHCPLAGLEITVDVDGREHLYRRGTKIPLYIWRGPLLTLEEIKQKHGEGRKQIKWKRL